MMKVKKTVQYHLEYHKANSQQNTLRCVEFVLREFNNQFGGRTIDSISIEDALSFLTKLTLNRKQTTKRNRYSVLSVISGLKTSQKHRIKTSTRNAAQTSAYQEIPTTDFLRPIPAIF